MGASVLGKDGRLWPGPHPVEDDAAPEQTRTLLEYDYRAVVMPPATAEPSSMWRYRALLPVAEGPIRYPLSVGGTPLFAPFRLRQRLGLSSLWLKDETRGPSGSNKDRATALVIEDGLRRRATTITAASTANVAVSTALGAAVAGLRAVIFVPATVPDLKLRLMLAAGAHVFRVTEGYEAAFRLSRRSARELGWLDRNTGVNPLTIEAKKTVAFEVWDQLGREAPDVVVVAVGDGTTLSGLAKGFRELRSCGGIDRLPRLLGVQSTGCQPLVRAWEGAPAGQSEDGTIADGIAVTAPIGRDLVLHDVGESAGALLAVPDDAIRAAVTALATEAGILAEPAAATALAGLEAALARGLVGGEERVVVAVTGSGLKTPPHLAAAGTVAVIDGHPDEALHSIRRLGG